MINRVLIQTSFFLFILMSMSSSIYAQELKLTSWNLEWLAVKSAPSIKPSQRTEQDFSALAQHFSTIKPHVLAFQEVDSIEALRKVVGNDYLILISDRSQKSNQNHQFKDLNQYTGFAIINSLQYQDPHDIKLLKKPQKLRFASYVIINNKNREPLHLLSVHLKAGCSGKFETNKSAKNSCNILKEQGENLNRWMQERIKRQQSFVILGDFNHNLSFADDWLWQQLSENIHDKIYLATKKTNANCRIRSQNNPKRTHQFKSTIDHIIVSQDLKNTDAKQDLFNNDAVLKYQLSDHCPVSILI